MVGIVIDVVLADIILLSLIIGVKRGLNKQLSGTISGLAAFIGAVVLTSLFLKLLQPVEFYKSWLSITKGWFKQETFAAPITTAEELAAALTEAGGFWKLLSSLSAPFFKDLTAMEYTTVSALFGRYVGDLIAGFILWLVTYVALKYLLKGIFAFLRMLTTVSVFKTIDRILGGVFAVALAYAIVIGLALTALEVVLIKFLPAIWDKVSPYVQQSFLLRYGNNTNFIGGLLADLFKVALPIFPTA